MKIRAEHLLINNPDLKYNKILVTGNDEIFIDYVTHSICKKFKNNSYHVDFSGVVDQNSSGDLFSKNKTLFVLKDYKPKEGDFEQALENGHKILLSSPNGQKTNTIKKNYFNSNDDMIVECYPLDKNGKENIIQKTLNDNRVKVSTEVFWFIVENFENDYVTLKNQLMTLSFLGNNIESVCDVEKSTSLENKVYLNKVFFYIFQSNKKIINIFKKNIYSQSDLYFLLNSFKFYLNIIKQSKSRDEALKKFPKYLFNEKEDFIKIYNILDKRKILQVYKNIFKAEYLIKKNSQMHLIIGVRFLINTKKIIIS